MPVEIACGVKDIKDTFLRYMKRDKERNEVKQRSKELNQVMSVADSAFNIIGLVVAAVTTG